jgi:hypothetical protein
MHPKAIQTFSGGFTRILEAALMYAFAYLWEVIPAGHKAKPAGEENTWSLDWNDPPQVSIAPS